MLVVLQQLMSSNDRHVSILGTELRRIYFVGFQWCTLFNGCDDQYKACHISHGVSYHAATDTCVGKATTQTLK
jgi:hypothetical protein